MATSPSNQQPLPTNLYDTGHEVENEFVKAYRTLINDTFYVPSASEIKSNPIFSAIKKFLTSTLIGNLAMFVLGAVVVGFIGISASSLMQFKTKDWLSFQALVILILLCSYLTFML